MTTELPRLLSIGHLPPDPQWRMAAHEHFFNELIVPVRGRFSVQIMGQVVHAGPGDVLLYPRGVAHEETSDRSDPVETFFIAFTWATLEGALPLPLESGESPEAAGRKPSASAPLLPQPAIHTTDINGRLRQLVPWLHSERVSHLPHAAAQRESLLHAILMEYLACCAHRQVEKLWIAGIRKFVRGHLEGPLTLGLLAEHAGLSPFHFLRTYRTLAGRTPMADVRAMRLEHARDLLLTTSLPLKQIAARCGLGSQYALSRLFRKHFNLTPGTLRRAAVTRMG